MTTRQLLTRMTARARADRYTVRVGIDNRELDSRQSTGKILWEGWSELIESTGKRRHLGLC